MVGSNPDAVSAGVVPRRTFIAFGALSAAALAASACSDQRTTRKQPPPLSTTAAPTGTAPQAVTTATTSAPHVQRSLLTMPATPHWPQSFIAAPQPLVDEHVNVFLMTADERDAQHFLMGWIPTVDFDQVLEGEVTDAPKVLGAAWVSGYWYGAYLQSLLGATQLNGALRPTQSPVNESSFRRLVSTAQRNAQVRSSGGEPLLNAVDSSLWRPSDVDTANALPFGLIEKFAAAYGTMQSLLRRAPKGAEPVDDFELTCSAGLACEFTIDKINASQGLDARFTQRLQTDAGLAGLRRRVDQVVADSTSRGQVQWQSLVDTRRLDPADYLRIVDMHSARLQCRRAAALAALEAVVQRDTAFADTAALGAEALALWDSAVQYGRARREPYRAAEFIST